MTTGSRAAWASSGATGHLPQGIIYPELVHSGANETLVQNTNLFNQATRNAIRMMPMALRGDFHQESFFKNVSNLVSRRNVASSSPGNEAVTPEEVPIDENISVKLNRRVGPVDQTFDSFRKLSGGGAPRLDIVSFAIGEQIAKALQVDMLDAGLRAAVAALSNQANVTIDIGPGASPQSTLTTDALIDALALFGDAANRIVCWVGHSKPYWDLVKEQKNANITDISSFNVQTAAPVTLNRPFLITDSAALTQAATNFSPITQGAQYTVLGLTEEGVKLMESEELFVYSDVITGNQNIVARTQGEVAFNVGVKGFRYDPANGGVNPDDTALATGTNWDSNRDSIKDFAGVVINCQ